MKKIMKETMEIVFILDRSGSMAGLEQDTIGGFNGLIEKQKREASSARVSLVLFDDQTEVILDRVPIEDIGSLSEEEYYVGGSTGWSFNIAYRAGASKDESGKPTGKDVVHHHDRRYGKFQR